MSLTTRGLFLLLTTFTPLVAAQQGVLVNGNSNLPACAQTCQSLVQAAQACSGTTSATQSTWVCFCQSAYLTSLKTPGSNLCSASCPASDDQQIATWYSSNCGSDNGASEHADDSTAATTTAADATTSTSAAVATETSSSSGSSSSSGGSENINNGNFNAGTTQTGQTWWTSHYKYIIMLIVLVVALPLLAWLAIWLKRRHDRKMDQLNQGFNSGITERAAPTADHSMSGGAAGSGIDGNGTDSPARTRDAFMPYGYGYSHSESRVGSKQAVYEDRRSPLARGEMDQEKEAGMAEEPGKKKPKRVLVQERSIEDDIRSEKR